MKKETLRYKLTVETLNVNTNKSMPSDHIELELQNEDDLFRIIEMVQNKRLFKNFDDNTKFSLGIKLLSDVLRLNYDHPIFQDMIYILETYLKKQKTNNVVIEEQ